LFVAVAHAGSLSEAARRIGGAAALAQARLRLSDPTGIMGLLRVSMPPDLPVLWQLCAELSRLHSAVRFG
jgi:hypothetical protein